ncbi:MAG: putative signal peptide protein, partial [Bacteroidota bacterium]
YSFSISPNELKKAISLNILNSNPNNPDYDNHRLAWTKLSYPHKFNFEGRDSFLFNITATDQAYTLEIDNFKTSSNPILYDLTTQQRLVANYDAVTKKVKINLPPYNKERQFLLFSHSNLITTLNPITFSNLQTNPNTDYLIISNAALKKDTNGKEVVQEYANYRSSIEGGSFNTAVVDVNDLYEQFGYGIARHPLAVRNFVQYLNDKSSTKLKYILLIGKAREYSSIRTNAGLDANKGIFFTPTFGLPGSDNLLVSNNFSPVPVASVGRVPITKASELTWYLDKIKEYERVKPYSLESQVWKKQAIFFSGGSGNNPSELNEIQNYVKSLASELKRNKVGATSHVFYRTTTDAIQVAINEDVYTKVKAGISLLSFFSHASSGAVDFSADDPSRYEVTDGRFPMIFSLGCFSGNIHTSTQGISERFVLAPNKGAHSFMATSGFGYVSALHTYMLQYYQLMGGAMYGASNGDLNRVTVNNILKNGTFGVGISELLAQFTICGDPAMRIYTNPEPDYLPDIQTVRFIPSILTAQMKTFKLQTVVRNIGKNIKDSIDVTITQSFPNGTRDTLLTKRISTPTYADTINFDLPLRGYKAVGLNHIFVNVDSKNKVQEQPLPYAEENNELISAAQEKGVPFYVLDNDAQPIYPHRFAIVNTPQVTLKASTSNPLAMSQMYQMELDTTETFDSPIKLKTQIIQAGGVLSWKPNIVFENERVYYWRVSPDSILNIGKSWQSSSFVYLKDKEEGWNQSHYYQFLADKYKNIELEKSNRDFTFINIPKLIRVATHLEKVPFSDGEAVTLGDNEEIQPQWPLAPEGILITVFNQKDLKIWNNPKGQYGSFKPYWDQNDYPNKGYNYLVNDATSRKNMVHFLQDSIPDGAYVGLMFIHRTHSTIYPITPFNPITLLDTISGKDIYTTLEKEGAKDVRKLLKTGFLPYAFIYQKGKGVLGERLAEDIEERIELVAIATARWVSGDIHSTIIGPATTWKTAEWQNSTYDNNPSTDKFSYDVYTIDDKGNKTLFASNQTVNTLDLSPIDAQKYPYLQLKLNSEDSINRTSTQLDYWRVTYSPVPEAAVNPSTLWSFESDTLQQGATLKMKVAVENLGRSSMKNVLVKYRIQSENNKELVFDQRYPILQQDSLIHLDFKTDTRSIEGKQRISIEVNPNKEQPELTLQNNFLYKDFYVERDRRNPLLDVTFDGMHILDGDIISPKPNILLTVKDENKYFLLDSSKIKLYLFCPETNKPQRIYFDGTTLRYFGPSSTMNNKARIEYDPTLLKDGTYQLLVYAEDGSGNHSSTHILKDSTITGITNYNYSTNFQVITKSSISNVLNYPNPFSTSTQFVYTLTGENPPTYFNIQIMTVSGKVIREITQDELGPMHIGTHRTDYAWDGTDQFGDKLAAGVYLYRIVAKKADGQDFENYEIKKADTYFKNGFGKLVILR